jgi:hypothetical protein
MPQISLPFQIPSGSRYLIPAFFVKEVTDSSINNGKDRNKTINKYIKEDGF